MDALELLKYVGGGGLSFAILIFLVKALNHEREKILVVLDKEREARIKQLESAAEACRADRQEMRVVIDKLQAEITNLYKTMLGQRTIELSESHQAARATK